MKLVRGPILRLPPHPEAVTDPADLPAVCRTVRDRHPGALLAADLFSGAGGLSLGMREAGVQCVLSVDHYAEAVETHAHHFPGLSVDWDLSRTDVVERVADLIRENEIEVLVGGPPCQPFSKAGRSGIRFRVQNGLRDPHDERRDLWRSFLEVAALARPRAVVMENVPDMALDTEMFILRAMVEELEQLGYAVEERVVDTWRYGVPQFRQRLILVALADGVAFEWPPEAEDRVTVNNAIGDLPAVEGGWRPRGGADGWGEYSGPQTSFQRRMRHDVPAHAENRIYDHITRPVREDDALAFELMDSSTRYSDLPASVKRYREDIFDDKYKRLDGNDLSRTITAHIAKDGYWYIHPEQGRTITVREAARLQTFPDHYRFAGGPSAAFKQIGNAVPPQLGAHLMAGVVRSLQSPVPSGPPSRATAATIAAWFEERETLALPWLRAGSRWQVVSASILADRAAPRMVRQIWSMVERWQQPVDTLASAAGLRAFGALSGRLARVEVLLALAEASAQTEGTSAAPEHAMELAALVVPGPREDVRIQDKPDGDDIDETALEEPVLARTASLRVAARYSAQPVDVRKKRTDGRLAVARMIGAGPSSRTAQLGLLELATAVCRPDKPLCTECPLVASCAYPRRHGIPSTLPLD